MTQGSSLRDTGREIAANLAMTIAGTATGTGIFVGAATTTVTRVGIASSDKPWPNRHAPER